MKSFKFILRYLKKYAGQYIAGIITLFVVDFAGLYIPRLTGVITDGLSTGSFDMSDVIRCLCGILALGGLMTLGRVGWRFFFMGTSRSVERDLRNDLFRHLTAMSNRYFQTHGSGDLMSRFTNDLSSIRQAIGPAVISLFDGTVMTVMVLCQMVFYVDYRLTLLTMIPMIIIAIGVLFYGKIMHKLYEERQIAISDLTDYSRESFTGIRVVKAFVREKYRLYEFAKQNINTRDKTLKANYMLALMMPFLDLIIEISILITLVYGGYLTIHGSISLGRFVAYNQYIIMLIWPMIACGDAVNSFSQGAASIERVREVLETEPEISDITDADDEALIVPEIEFRNLTFMYPDREDAGLFGVNFTIEPGRTTAFVGKTGCGKSTVVDLLLRIYRVNDGSIFVSGKDINSLTRRTLRDSISYVPQDDFLFSDTILNNIAFGVDETNKEKIMNAAKTACIHDSIMDFPDGYETMVGERGVTLSGGQKQRVCIARALLKDSPILIMDDSLSAVDTDTERLLLGNILNERKGKTTIIIAHRISTVSYADRIVVLDEGKVVQIGSHSNLIEEDGPYKEMYIRQQLEDEYGNLLA